MSLRNTIGIIAVSMILFVSCKNDSTTTVDSTEISQSNDNHDGHDHDGHDHAGHDHSGHDHAGHDHSSEASESEVQEKKAPPKTGTFNGVDVSIKGIPNPCKLLSAEFIKENTFLKPQDVRIKSGTKRGDSDHRACFFQWDTESDPNAGFLVNIAVNPIPEEISDYPTVFMRAKKMDGETDMGSDKAFPYKHIEGLGVEAMGCKELKKYYFRQDDETLFMIAYNLPLNKSQMDELTKTIGNEVLKNYNATMN